MLRDDFKIKWKYFCNTKKLFIFLVPVYILKNSQFVFECFKCLFRVYYVKIRTIFIYIWSMLRFRSLLYLKLLLFLMKSSSSRFAMETNQFIIRHYRLFFHYFLTMFWWHQVLRALIHANNKWEKYILFFIYLFFTKLFGYDGGITSTKFLWQL